MGLWTDSRHKPIPVPSSTLTLQASATRPRGMVDIFINETDSNGGMPEQALDSAITAARSSHQKTASPSPGPVGVVSNRGPLKKRWVTNDLGDRYQVQQCRSCLEWLPLTTEFFVPKGLRADGKRALDGRCRTCRYKVQRDWYASLSEEERKTKSAEQWQRIKANPKRLARSREQGRIAMANQRAQKPEHFRKASQKYYRDMRNDPERLTRHREAVRMTYRLRAEKQGRKVLNRQPELAESDENVREFPRLPVQPLSVVVLRMIDRAFEYGEKDALGAMCRSLGIATRTVTRWRSGEGLKVSFNIADQILSHLGLLWWEVWTEETTRKPILLVTSHARRQVSGGRSFRIRTAARTYGDLGPDVEGLATVRYAFTGEGDCPSEETEGSTCP